MKVVRRGGFIVVLLLGIVQLAFAELPMRRPMPGAPSGPTRPAPPARTAAPYQPLELSNPMAGLQQSTVRWKIPDQSNGRLIAQWLVRACPKVDGTPYAACQQVQQLNGPNGQSSGTYVQAQIPAHVMFMGADTPVNGAEVCSANSAGTSCADRIAVRFVNPGIAPAPAKLHGAAPSGTPSGTLGIRAAPGARAALTPPGGAQPQQGPAAAMRPGTTRGIIVVARPPAAPQSPERTQSATTGGGPAFGSLANRPATAAVMVQTVHTAQITADGNGSALSSSVIPGLVHTSSITADGNGLALSSSVIPGLVHTGSITADGTGFALSSSVVPGLVHTSPITADGTGTLTHIAGRPSLRLK